MSGERNPTVQEDSYHGDSLAATSKHLDSKCFRYKHTKVEHLQDAIEKNAILESSPNRHILKMETLEQALNLRPRQEDRELSRHFRFKATCQAERIAESVAIVQGFSKPKSLMPDNLMLRATLTKLKTLEVPTTRAEARNSSISKTAGSMLS